MTLDLFNAFTVTVTPQSVWWKYSIYTQQLLTKYHVTVTLRWHYIDVPRPLTNDLWVFLFQTIGAECVK